jgi:hypothetical protein
MKEDVFDSLSEIITVMVRLVNHLIGVLRGRPNVFEIFGLVSTIVSAIRQIRKHLPIVKDSDFVFQYAQMQLLIAIVSANLKSSVEDTHRVEVAVEWSLYTLRKLKQLNIL